MYNYTLYYKERDGDAQAPFLIHPLLTGNYYQRDIGKQFENERCYLHIFHKSVLSSIFKKKKEKKNKKRKMEKKKRVAVNMISILITE